MSPTAARFDGRCALSRWLTILAVLSAFAAAGPAKAFCLAAPLADAGPLAARAEWDPRASIRAADIALRHRRTGNDAAWLWAAKGMALYLLDDGVAAGKAAEEGLRVLGGSPSSARLQLTILVADALEDPAAISKAIADIERTRSTLPRDSAADICALVTIGQLRHSIDQPAEATRSVAAAYRASQRPGLEMQRAWAAMMMSAIMYRAHDVDRAIAFNREAIALSRRLNLRISVANALYQRGLFLMENRKYDAALVAMDEAAKVAVLLQGAGSDAYSDMGACEALLELHRLAAARARCNRAAGPIGTGPSGRKIAWLLARIDLAEHRPQDALARLSKVLDGRTVATAGTIARNALATRAEAQAAIGNFADAYADQVAHTERLRQSYDDILRGETATLRAQSDADRRDLENLTLQHELGIAQLRGRNATRLIIGGALGGSVIIALLGYIIVAGRAGRRRLAHMAGVDVLTGLPNRRRTSEFGAAMLATSARHSRTLSIAILDLDTFKTLNDRYGHPAGDQALEIFAATARTCLRESDFIGRWGGDEFLVILPDTDADTASAVIARLHSAIAERPLDRAEGWTLRFSAGIAGNKPGDHAIETLVARADIALYRAKRLGRGQSATASDDAALSTADRSV